MPDLVFSWNVTVLALFVASVLYLHFRGKERYTLWKQFTNFSALLAPYSALMYLSTAVSRRPIFDTAEMPALDPLLDHWEEVRDEAERLVHWNELRVGDGRREVAFSSFFRRGWKRFYVKWYDEPLPSAQELCPRTVELVQSIPELNAAMFTVLPPGGKLPLHRDPFAGSLRLHLGLITPNSEKCRIWVDGEQHVWRDGQGVMFDQTYLHRAENKADAPRVILLCDVDRPLNNPIARALNRFMTRYVVKYTAPRNDDGPDSQDREGIVNVLSKPVFAFRSFAKKIKKAHKGTYKFLSHFLKAVAVGLFVYLLVLR